MNQKQIKHITNNYYTDLKKLIRTFEEDLNAKVIHEFRVKYKKLRAFFRMLSNQQEKTRIIKISKKLKKVYHISGSIRDLQLQQQRIRETTDSELKKPLAYIQLLQKEIEKLKPVLMEIILKRPVAESKKKTDVSVPDEFHFPGVSSFIQKKWTSVYVIIVSSYFTDDHIHTVRKHLKDLFYNLEIVEGIEQEILLKSIWTGKDKSWVYQLLEELGNYQDKCTAVALIRPYWLRGFDGDEREMLNRIKKDWIKDKRKMKRSLVKKMKVDIIPLQTAHSIVK